MPCTVVVGGFFGDEGKGHIVSYLALNDRVDVTVRTGSVNAGHTVVWKGKEYGLRTVPASFVNENSRLYLGSGFNLNPRIFFQEIELTGTTGRIWVDRQCSIIDAEHIQRDQASGGRIGTTGQGVGPSIEDRVKRVARLAKDVPELTPYLADVPYEVNASLDRGEKVLLEGSQGTFLSLFHGTYPYVTARDTTSSAVCSEVGVGPKRVDDVLLVFKAFVSRVGKGPLEGELSREEALKRGWLEVATVTRRERRAASFNLGLARRAVMLNSPTQLALTKLDIVFPECRGVHGQNQLTAEAKEFVAGIEDALGVTVTLIGTGPNVEDVIDRRRG